MAETTNRTDPFSPIHPGEILKTELMVPYGLSANRLAKVLEVADAAAGQRIAATVVPLPRSGTAAA